MPTRVADLKEHLDGIRESTLETTLGDISVDDEARVLTVKVPHDEAREFWLDEQVERSFAKFLGIPKAYLEKCDPDLKAHNLNAWFQKKGNASAVIEMVGDEFVTVHKAGLVIIPLSSVVNVISKTLDPEFEVLNLIRNDTRFQIDVLTPHRIEVEPWEALEDRNPLHQATVGDITHGGIRFRANPTEVEEPVVQTYLHRLWCSNGSTSPIKEGTIKLKGNTVDEVLVEIEEAMQRVVGDLDNKLESYAALATKYAPGSKEAFARQLAEEYKIPARVLLKIIPRIEILPDGASLYDILNVFTSFANEEGVKYETVLKLQELGGALAFDTDAVTHRCGTCERLLP